MCVSAQMLSFKLTGFVVFAIASTTVLAAPDKVWYDEKGLRAELVDKFKSQSRVKIRDDQFEFHGLRWTLTETDGLHIRFMLDAKVSASGRAHMFLEFDAKGKLAIAKATVRYGDKTFAAKPVYVSGLTGITRNEPRDSLINKVANALQANIKEAKIEQSGRVRTPDFGATARYMVVMVAKHVWYGPKVMDHRTGSGGRDDRRGDDR